MSTSKSNQSFSYSLPGIIIGLLITFVATIPVAVYLASFTATPIVLGIQSSALALGLCLGLFLPFIGIIVPIRRALTQTLRDALDVYHNVVFDTAPQLQSLQRIGFELNETVISLVVLGLGLMVFYFLPLSFILQNNDLLFNILVAILLGMN